MKNDFDYIKDKFEHSGVEIPEGLSEQSVLEKLPETKLEVVKPKRNYKKYTALAASVAVLTIAALSLSLLRAPIKTAEVSEAQEQSELLRFNSIKELKNEIKRINSENKVSTTTFYSRKSMLGFADEAYAESDTAAGGSATAKSNDLGAAQPHSDTYKQVENVDEADIVKTDGKCIYAVYEDNYVSVIDPNGKKSKEIAKIKPPYSEYEASINDIFLNDDLLTIIMTHSDASGNGYTVETLAYVYDVSNPEKPAYSDKFGQSGSYISSRMIDGRLYLVSNDYPDAKRVQPVITCGNEYSKLDCKCIYSVEKPKTPTLLVVSEFDTKSGRHDKETKAILGTAGTVYCSEKNLYTASYNYPFVGALDYLDDRADGSATDDEADDYTPKTQLVKINIEGGVEFTASGKVEGYINDQYSLDEKDGYLRVATTSYKDDKDINNLYILDSSLKKVGEVGDFAKDESIKAVKYVGDTAYVITYEQTDPLFVIDLKDVKAPKILGSVKITGFSSMLVPVDDNTLLGIGYNTEEADYTDMEVAEGVKLALFDVSDKLDPKVLDSKVFKNYDSPVQYEPKALTVNPDKNTYSIPLNRDYYSEETDDEEFYGGSLTVRVDAGKINIVKQYKSDIEQCDRCVYIGDELYLLELSAYNGEGIGIDSVKPE